MKLKLSDLKVSSFVTSLDGDTVNTIKGGTNGVNCTNGCSHNCPSFTCPETYTCPSRPIPVPHPDPLPWPDYTIA